MPRPKGSRNKSSLAAADIFKYYDFEPLSRMIKEYQASDDPRVRASLLKELIKYKHPALQSIEHKGDGGGPVQITVNYDKGSSTS